MGVSGLKTYVDGTSMGSEERLNGKLLIDGHSLAHHIYFRLKAPWTQGGDYDLYRSEIVAFLAALRM
jgi:hypothetical protein